MSALCVAMVCCYIRCCRVAENPVETCQLVYNHLQKLLAIITPKMEESKGQERERRAGHVRGERTSAESPESPDSSPGHELPLLPGERLANSQSGRLVVLNVTV